MYGDSVGVCLRYVSGSVGVRWVGVGVDALLLVVSRYVCVFCVA